MIFGVKMRIESWRLGCRRWGGGLCVVMTLVAPAWAQNSLDLNTLMGLLSQRRSGEAVFTETRFVQILDAPQVSSGRLSFSAPDRFVRETLQPKPESVSVDGNTVQLMRHGRTRTLSLDSAPEVRAMVEAVRGTLTGNAEALQRLFKPVVSGSTPAWTLDLTPLPGQASGPIRLVRIEGRQDEVRTVEVTLNDGDRSLMKIEPVVASPSSAPSSGASGGR